MGWAGRLTRRLRICEHRAAPSGRNYRILLPVCAGHEEERAEELLPFRLRGSLTGIPSIGSLLLMFKQNQKRETAMFLVHEISSDVHHRFHFLNASAEPLSQSLAFPKLLKRSIEEGPQRTGLCAAANARSSQLPAPVSVPRGLGFACGCGCQSRFGIQFGWDW